MYNDFRVMLSKFILNLSFVRFISSFLEKPVLSGFFSVQFGIIIIGRNEKTLRIVSNRQ